MSALGVDIAITVVGFVIVVAVPVAESIYYNRRPKKTPPDVSMWP